MKKMSMLLVMLLGSKTLAIDLNEFLSQVQQKHRGFKSLNLSIEAAEGRRQSGDIGLVPSLQLKSIYTRDEKQPNSLGATRSESTLYSLGFNQKFSTGTNLTLAAGVGKYENPGIATPSVSAGYSDFIAGGLTFSVSQSLWKDAFGHGTSLRRQREFEYSRAEKFAIETQLRSLLSDAEKTYWDYVYGQEELRLRKASLVRSQRIESWVQRRVSDGIGDRADLLNAKALVAARQLQLQMSQDDFLAVKAKMLDLLEIQQEQNLPEISGSIYQVRSPFIYVSSNKKVLTLESYGKILESKLKSSVALETEDGLKSDLVLAGSYGSNPYRVGDSLSYGVSNLGVFERPTSSVSLTWSYLFDSEVKNSTLRLAQTEAMSSKFKSERAVLESDTQWKEYLRRYQELNKKIETAVEISLLQTERAKAEQDKLSKGRSITQNVILAEQDAADAELNLIKLKAEQRKLEAQGRFFISEEAI